MNYIEAMTYIDHITAKGIMPGLERIQILLELAGHPEKHLNVIHVAGTNGKGSVCTFIASILSKSNAKVGRYISPTLFDYRERIRCNGNWISEDEICEYLTILIPQIQKMEEEYGVSPSAFELETVMAFMYFREQQCDYVVLECGMGGLSDATNVIDAPLVSVITSISMDHMKFLGRTLPEIARQKAGIIKNRSPVIYDGENLKTEEVILECCHIHDSRAIAVSSSDIIEKSASIDRGQIFDYKDMSDLCIRMLGHYQLKNAAIAIEAAWLLAKKDERINEASIREGLSAAKWPGRFAVVSRRPLVITDGAHNPGGAEELKASVHTYLHGTPLILVMGVFADKDYTKMLEIVSELSDTLITFRPENQRGLDENSLLSVASSLFARVKAFKTQKEALDHALKICGEDEAILHFGSLSTAAGIYHYFNINEEDHG